MQGNGKAKKKSSGMQSISAVLALVAGCSFGIGGAVSQIIVGLGFTITQYVPCQFIFTVLFFGILTFAKYRDKLMPVKLRIELVVFGAVTAIAAFAYYIAIENISLGSAVALQFQYVWMVVVMQIVVTRKLPKKWTVISALLIIVGTVFGSGLFEEIISGGVRMDSIGLISILVCAVFYALNIFGNSCIAVEYDAVPRSFFIGIGSFITSIIAMPIFGFEPFDFMTLLPWALIMALTMGILPSLGIVIASSNLPSGLVAILTSSELPAAVIAGCVILGEQVTVIRIIGVVIILASIALAQLDDRDIIDEIEAGGR